MGKRLLLLTTILVLFQITVVFSQITIGTVDAGPYTPGSSIAATYDIGTDCIKPGNKFELYLSDASGNFSGNNLIGSYTGFYSAFVNGTIPTTSIIPGSNYRLQIRSTQPVLTAISNAFEIKSGAIATAAITSVATTINQNPLTFGSCNSNTGTTSYNFTNASTSDNVTAKVTNELDAGPVTLLTYTSAIRTNTFTANQAHYTILAKVTMPDGAIGTQAYFLINNPAITAFTTTSGSTVCYPTGSFEYIVTVDGSNGINRNFPGNTYKIDWGDGNSDEYTYCDIKSSDSRVKHTFTESSCGQVYQSGNSTKYNVFGVNVSLSSPFCTRIGTPISTIAGVFTRPVNKFTYPEIGCKNQPITFTNESTAGEKGDEDNPECTDNLLFYTWYVDDVPVAIDQPRSFNLTHTFTTKGSHTVRLSSTTQGTCQADVFERTICIQDPPKPSFTLPSQTICLTLGTITPINTSIVDNTCPGAIPVYTWTVTPAANVTYVGGTNSHSPIPQFKFSQIGRYDITLNIQSATCQATTLAQQVVVDGEPQATLSGEKKLCQIGQLTFNPGATNTATIISGNAVDLPDTYTWEITGGRYNFVAPSTANSKYPTINFTDYAAYTIKLTYKNACNIITRTQLITFYESPIASITAITNPICFNDNINLQGDIQHRTAQTTFRWVGASGGVFSDPSSLTTTYTPTTAERDAGIAHIRLLVNTGLAGTCAEVDDAIDVTITPNNISTNPIPTRTQTICTGGLATFIPSSVVTGSTFTWTATNADGNATGFSPTGTGNISEAITNTHATQNAVVVYTITPATTECTGVPFNFTLTVTPKPIISTPELSKTICHDNPAAITVTSNIPTQYRWTSVASPGITGNTGATAPTALTVASNSYIISDVLSNSAFSPGTVTYTIKSYSGDCEGNTITVVVTVDPVVTQANAGPDATICDTDSYDLKGNKANVGTGLWRLVSTHPITPVIAAPTNFETTVTGLVSGQAYTFEWAITGTGKCSNTDDQVTITVTPIPVISPVADKTICHNNPAAITITSDIPAQFTWTSTASAGITGNTGFPTATAPTATANSFTINDALLNSTFLPGTVTYTIKSYSAEGCEGNTITVVVTVDPAVTQANAGPDISICNTGSYDLKGNKAEVGTGLWRLISTHPVEPVIAVPTDFETTATGLVAGQAYTFEWAITGTGKCSNTDDQVTITVNIPTVPGATSGGQTVCQNNNTGTITLSGNNGSVLGWQSLTDGETTWKDIPGANTNLTYSFTNLAKTTQFRAIVQNPGCLADYSTPATITVAPATTIADAGLDRILCNETSVLLKGNPLATGETGMWTQTSGDANAVITQGINSEATVTNLISGVTYVFRWTISGNTPCGPTHDEVTIRNNEPIDLNSITTNAVVCNGQQVTILGSSPTGGAENGQYDYVWESQINGGSWEVVTGETGKDLTITLTTTGTVSFRRIVNSGTCTSTSNAFPITVQPPISNNNIAADQTICSGLRPAIITGDTPTGGDGNYNYQWQSSPDGTTWADIQATGSQNYHPPILTETIYYRRIVSTLACNGSLKSTSLPVKITVTPNAKAEFTWGASDTGCFPYNLPVVVVVPHPDRNATYTWYVNNELLPSTGANFPGYTIETSGTSVTIKLDVTSSLNCENDTFSHTFSTNQAVPASFDVSDSEGCGPLTVNLTNTSLLVPGARFEWYNGDVQFSSDVHPPAMILEPDPTGKDSTYVIKLKAITDCGIDSVIKTVFVKAKPIAVFTPDKVEVCSPSKITFTNTSPGSTNTYYYDFGDGSPIVSKDDTSSVDHIYIVTVTTEFTVRMTAENSCGTDFKEWTIRVFPQNITPVLGVKLEEKEGCAPHTVNFENNSIGASRYFFEFGDGNTRTTYAPGIVTHTYTTSGKFTITMTAYNSCSEIPVTNTVNVLPQPVADFETENILGCPGLVVKFKNNTQGGITNNYIWDFGDGESSQDFEPEHTYTGAQEYYTVKLIATNQLGCPIEVSRNQYIHIVQPPEAAFNVNPSTLISIPDYTFKFEDQSTNNPTIWEWDFGDGTGSALKNPNHTYLDTGTYRVTLKVQNQNGCYTTTFKEVTIKGVPGYLFVPNSFIPGSDQPELRLFSAKGSGLQTWRFSIFNKWGQLLWETTNLEEGRPTEGWDGTFKGQPMPQGVYYWKIDVQMVNGSEWKGMTYDKAAAKRTGAIHLIR